jgi:hypothetical protein
MLRRKLGALVVLIALAFAGGAPAHAAFTWSSSANAWIDNNCSSGYDFSMWLYREDPIDNERVRICSNYANFQNILFPSGANINDRVSKINITYIKSGCRVRLFYNANYDNLLNTYFSPSWYSFSAATNDKASSISRVC